MKIRSTILARPTGGIAVASDSYDAVMDKALQSATLDSPVLVALSEPGSPNYIIDREAFRDARLKQLAESLGKIGKAALREWSPSAADLVDGFVYVLGAHETVAKAMLDGRVTAGEVIEITNVALEGATLIREHTDPFEPRGPDDGFRAPQTRPETGLDTSRNVLGVLAKTRGAYLGLAPSKPTILRQNPSLFDELAKAFGPALPLLGSAFTALDVLTDEAFHEVLPLEPTANVLEPWSPFLQTLGQDVDFGVLQHIPAKIIPEPSTSPYDTVLRSMREIMPSLGGKT